MKKPMLIIAAACAAAACFGGCSSCDDTPEGVSGYDALNTMLDLNYSGITLTVTDTFDEETFLVSEYKMDFSGDEVKISYSVERFTDISLDTADAVKTTLTGEAVIKDGKVVIVDGAYVDISADIAETGLNFKEEYFENAELAGVYLIADVKNPSAFIGASVDCTDMTVRATFLEVLYDVKINYTAKDGNSVEIKYVFRI